MNAIARRWSPPIVSLSLCLLLVIVLTGSAPAQTVSSVWDLCDVPSTVDLLFAYHPSSDQAVFLVPAEGVSLIPFENTPAEQITIEMIDPTAWVSGTRLELWPGETVVLRSTEGQIYTVAMTSPPSEDLSSLQVTYAPLSAPAAAISMSLALYTAVDIDTGETFVDDTVASVIPCDAGSIVPTPTPPPAPIPEPGSLVFFGLGLLGLLGAWRLSRRKGRQFTTFWLVLLGASLLFGVLGLDNLVAQYGSCLLTIDRQGSGSGHVIGENIDCGDTCVIDPLLGGAGVGSGDVIHLKAIADADSRFLGWQVNGEPYQGLFRMIGDTILTARFEAKQPPAALNDTYLTEEDTVLQITAPGVLLNDTDPDSAVIQAMLLREPTHGQVSLNPDGSFTYTPDPDVSGIDQFLYRASDSELDSAIAVVSLTVAPVSEPPVAHDLSVETVKNHPVTITLQGEDGDGDDLTYLIIDPPAHGSLSGGDNIVDYAPAPDFLGQDSFTYLVNDGSSDSNIATVTIHVRDIDLAIGPIDLSDTIFDEQTLTLIGIVHVTIDNVGAEAIADSYEVQVFVKDLHTASSIELGTATVSTPLTASETMTVDVSVNGAMLFKDNPIYAFVDNQNVITESNEENNIAHHLVDCQIPPAEPGSFEPVLEWEWTGNAIEPHHTQVMSIPVVAQLNDDNGDGNINNKDIPDVIFNAFAGDLNLISPYPIGYSTYARLRAISGDGSGELFCLTDFWTSPSTSPAVGDIDADGIVEIITVNKKEVLAFEHDGTFKWSSADDLLGPPSITLADIDHDGLPEIIAGALVLNPDGTTKWMGQGGGYACVANLDLEGAAEVILGNTAYHEDGSIYWHTESIGNGFCAVANFNSDPYPEFISVQSSTVTLLTHLGEQLWQIAVPGGGGGAPCIADMDHDGEPEIGVAGGANYVVFETDGQVKWTMPTQDWSSQATGSSVFDFEGDGKAEIVYADELHLYIYDGATGEILFQEPIGSGTLTELPIIVDVDNDNNAEIVVASNDYYRGPKTGIQVFGDVNDSWVNTRKIWNQHSYHITNVNDDGTIPQFEANSWEVHNTYRCNISPDALACEDYSASYVRVNTAQFPDSVEILARIGNAGIVDAAFPLNVAFYHGDPASGGTLIAVTTTEHALQSGDYEDVSITWNIPPLGFQDIYVSVDDDGTGQGIIRESDETNNVASTTIYLNAPPVAEDDAYTTDEDVVFEMAAPGVLANDSDANGDPLTVTLVDEPTHGTLDLHDDGSFSYWPAPDFFGTDQFTYTASDGIRSSEACLVIITVTPINDPPMIITDPVKQAIITSSGGTPPESFDLRDETWTPLTYGDCLNNDYRLQCPYWDVQESGMTVTQLYNAMPGIFLYDEVLSQVQIEGTLQVLTWIDDDAIGFVFGYQDSGHFYLFYWNQANYNSPYHAGMGVSLINTETRQSLEDYHIGGESGLEPLTDRLLYRNYRGWEDYTIYRFVLRYGGGLIHIQIFEGVQLLESIVISDATYLTGKFGFYNFSQDMVRYSGFTHQSIALPEYAYDVDAIDPEDDPISYRVVTHPEGMAINSATGRIVWDPTSDQIGDHPVEVRVEDDHGGVDTQQFLVAVTDEWNHHPIIVSIPPTVTVMDTEYLYAVEAMDADEEVLTYTLSASPEGMSIDQGSGQCRWTPGVEALGEHRVTIRVTDGRGGYDDQTYILWVIEANSPPHITSLPVISGAEGIKYTYDVEATDAAYDRVTYTLIEAPDGMSIDSGSGFIKWEASSVLRGEYPVTIQVTDLLGAVTEQTFTLTISSPPTPPQVTLHSPDDGTTVVVGHPVPLAADASDEDGSISRVEFYHDTTLLGTDSEAPYAYQWTPTVPGTSHLRAVAYDTDGASTTSDAVTILVTPPENHQPEISSEPVYAAVIDELYSYDVEASDPDDDPLTFSLTDHPQGMTIDAVSGLITWMPSAAQVGQHSVTLIVDDGRGAGASQSYVMYVPEPSNSAPQITSAPVFTARVGEEYVYDVEASDAESDPLSFRFMKAPAGMGLHPQSGLITWTPTEDQVGTHILTVAVEDGRNGLGGQSYTLTVRPPNVLPSVSISAPGADREVEEGDTLTIRAETSDSDGSIDRIEFVIDTEPGAQSSDCTGAQTSVCSYDWPAAGLGEHTITAIAYDNDGALTESEPVSITVIEPLPDTEAPVISITVTPEYAQVGEDIVMQVSISDDSAINDLTLDINGTSLSVDNNQAVYTTQTTGFFTVTVSATDSAGNTGSGSALFGVSDGSDTTPPEVDLADAVEFECIELAVDLYDITGTVNDDNDVHYQLLSREKGTTTWEILAEGLANPLLGGVGVGSVLATFDPTTHRNGLYDIRLLAEDTAGNRAEITGCLLVDGRFKVGQSSIGGIDFNLPQFGYPLLAGRIYDSRNLDGGSFGPGWSLPHEGSNVQAEFSYEPYEGWGEDVQGGLFATYILVPRSRKVLALRLGEQVFKFRMEVTSKTSFMRPIMDNYTPLTVSYVPVDETEGSLEALGVDSEVFLFSYNDGTLADGEGDDYNPTRFRLTLEDGSVYIFDKNKGLLSMTDPYGHAISYSDNGISYSSGASLSFQRDTSDRIERIVDDLGRTIEYRYGEDGMLQQVIQQGGGSYATKVLESYAYKMGINEVPVLKDILAPDGTRLGTFEYDSQGRKIGLIDHEGHRVVFGYDAPAHHYTVTDRRGNPTHYSYDSDGNVTGITDAEGNSESYSYDEHGYLLSKTNKLGYTNAYTYDDDGNLLTETDPLGNSVSFTYDEDGNKLTATDPLGNTTSFTYDSYGNVLTQKDALGFVSTLAYDGDGNLTSTTDALGHRTSYEYDEQGSMRRKTDALGRSMSYVYDLYGHVISSTDAAGNVTANEYDGAGSLVKTIDAAGKVHQYTHNSSHKIEQYIDPLGNEINNSFDQNGLLTVAKDASGHEVHFDYDPNGNQTELRTTVTTGDGPETFLIEKVYDALNRPTEEIDGDGRSVKAEYDALGRQTAVIDKQGNRTEVSYDPRGLITQHTGPDGRGVSNTYDAAGRLTTQTNAQGGVTSYEYNAFGKVIKTIAPNGTVTDNEYDALERLVSMSTSQGETITLDYGEVGRLVAMTDESGRITRYEYSSDGRLAKTIDAKGNITAYTHDDSGNVTSITLPDQSTISYAYDDFGRKIAETNQHGQTTAFAWGESGKLKQVVDAAGHATEYDYNDIGYLIAKTNANGHRTHYEYDKLGRMTKKTYPLGMSQSFQYEEGNSFSITDFNGATTEYAFDTSGQIISITLPDGTGMSYGYTSSGELSSVTDLRGTTSFSYDENGRLLTRTEPDGRAISYGYDAEGRRTSVTVPSGTTQYDYDDAGRLVSVTDPDGDTTRYTYDADDNLEQVIYPNGTTTEYGYDTFNRVVFVENRTVTGSIISSYTYTLGSQGERLRVEDHFGRTVEYMYDERGQLTEERISEPDGSARVINYTYDSAGNRLTKNDNGVIISYIYDDNDRLLTEGDITYSYDNNGNLLSRTGPGMEQRFTYNALNQLIHAEMTSSQGTTTIDYVYDHDGIRVGKTINGTDVVTYLVDANRPYAQVIEEAWTRGGLSATTNYVYGHGLVSQIIDGVNRFYHYDGFHNTRALSDMSGTVTDTYRYDAYGALLNQTGTTSNPYLYRGEQFDVETDAYYLRARYYQPGTGRFLSTDPVEGDISEPMTLHRYLYGNNAPVNHIDPSGEFSLNEAIVTSAIIMSDLSALGWVYGDLFQRQYAEISDWFPDAGIIGVSLFGKWRFGEGMPTLLNPSGGIGLVNKLMTQLPPNLSNGFVISRDAWWQESVNAGITGGFEFMWNFGSSQRGYFWYWGPQIESGYTKGKRQTFRRFSLDVTLYTGYVFNLWNCNDYLGAFMAFNFPGGSYFFDLEDVVTNEGPWGPSWPILSHSFRSSRNQTAMTGLNSTKFRSFFLDPHEVPYGQLAVEWTASQIIMMGLSAWKQNNVAAVTTGVSASFTGLIARSKQIYNRQHSFDLKPVMRSAIENNRPSDWRSGPSQPLSKLIGLFL